jgi:tetratricopeptide (TPR) repeat protein
MNKRNPMLFQKMSKILFDKHFYGDVVLNASVALEQLNSSADKTHLTSQQHSCILLRGKSLVFLKEFEEAQTNFQRILDFDEKCIESRMGKATACLFRGKSDQAIAIFKKGEELNETYPNYMSWMALAYFLRKDYDNCEIYLKKYAKKVRELPEKDRGTFKQQQPLFDLLNYLNFFYLDEDYAKSSFEKYSSMLDFEALRIF